MITKKRQFTNGKIYHLILRRIGDNLLFKDTDDYYRGIFSIYEFNNFNSVEIALRRRKIKIIKKKNREKGKNEGGPTSSVFSDKREKLVDILAFCFMPNHIHLLVKQLKDGGISKFMQKVGTGYASYFKKKYNLKQGGYFFQERFVAVHIQTDEQLKVTFAYIHMNPISLIEPKWKEKGRIKNLKKAIEIVENYKWSSYLDYIGEKNFPSVTERNFLLEVMNSEQGCKDFVSDWIKYRGKIKEFPEFSLGEK